MNNLDSNNLLCPKCGNLHLSQIKICNDSLKFQNFNILPILPACKICGSEIIFNFRKLDHSNRKVIVLTGTCASGKTTTAETLICRHGFYAIDGDCVLHIIKHKIGYRVEYNSIEVLDEISYELDFLLTTLQKDIVITQVITPDDIDKYRKTFQDRNLNYKFFLLKPNYQVSVQRSKLRTCFNSITEEKWIKYFHDELEPFNITNHDDLIILDNSNQTVDESASFIIERFDKT